jgi:hypothetical protein
MEALQNSKRDTDAADCSAVPALSINRDDDHGKGPCSSCSA